ncbi:hypothetical protein UFOVP456_35 [uncultured Caudovirales phage]|uniref:Uncharacterized protein n=1 Tax=uncultured Caudovirales phage TaxID=2100421 RepID=A0A6J5MBD3_9CAUD|nr:hypothetical protein UFOVP456_35 [uncultured Caudovirales phage]
MILDERNEFADATALNTGAAGDYVIGDVIDLGVARDIGNGADLDFVVQVDTTATSGGSATLQISLATDDNASLSSPTKVVSSQAVAVASLTAGTTIFRVKVPAGTYERYLGIVQTTGTAAFTAGKINAFLTSDTANWRAYNDAI